MKKTTKAEIRKQQNLAFHNFKDDELKRLIKEIKSLVKKDNNITHNTRKVINAVLLLIQHVEGNYPVAYMQHLQIMLDPTHNLLVECRSNKRSSDGTYHLTPLGEKLTDLYNFEDYVKDKFKNLPQSIKFIKS